MKKTYLFFLAALTLGLAACDNYFDEKYLDNGDQEIKDVKTYDYLLLTADYSTIADNAVNKAYAAALDSVNSTTKYSKALKAVGDNKCFSENASADMYVPAFIYNMYPQLDQGSIFNATYLTDEGLPEYLERYNLTEQYTLTSADYKEIWGNSDTKYLTPATLAKLPDVLPQIADDYLLGVIYNYSSKEPDNGGSAEEVREELYLYKNGVTWERFVSTDPLIQLLPQEANGQAIKWLNVTFPFPVEDQVAVLMTYNSKRKYYDAVEYKYNGVEWLATTGIVQETMSFILAEGWAANLSTYFRQAVAGEANQGKITTQDVQVTGTLSYVWSFQSAYGMVANGYLGGPNVCEGWCILPAIRLKNSKEPALSFDQAQNYVTDSIRFHQLTVWVSTDYAGDVTTATWTQLPWNKDEEGNVIFPTGADWTYVNTGRMDLSAWNNQTIYIGFRYKTAEGEANPKWEVKNILVNEPEPEDEE